MSLTVTDEIAAVLIARLEDMIDNDDYTTQVVEVVRPLRLGEYTPKDSQIVVTQANPERVPELDCPGNPPALCWSQRFNLNLHVMPSESEDTPVDQLVNQFAADVMKAVTTSVDQWHTFGGFARDAEWLSQENIETGEGCDGINVPLEVRFRASENNPYEVRS